MIKNSLKMQPNEFDSEFENLFTSLEVFNTKDGSYFSDKLVDNIGTAFVENLTNKFSSGIEFSNRSSNKENFTFTNHFFKFNRQKRDLKDNETMLVSYFPITTITTPTSFNLIDPFLIPRMLILSMWLEPLLHNSKSIPVKQLENIALEYYHYDPNTNFNPNILFSGRFSWCTQPVRSFFKYNTTIKPESLKFSVPQFPIIETRAFSDYTVKDLLKFSEVLAKQFNSPPGLVSSSTKLQVKIVNKILLADSEYMSSLFKILTSIVFENYEKILQAFHIPAHSNNFINMNYLSMIIDTEKKIPNIRNGIGTNLFTTMTPKPEARGDFFYSIQSIVRMLIQYMLDTGSVLLLVNSVLQSTGQTIIHNFSLFNIIEYETEKNLNPSISEKERKDIHIILTGKESTENSVDVLKKLNVWFLHTLTSKKAVNTSNQIVRIAPSKSKQNDLDSWNVLVCKVFLVPEAKQSNSDLLSKQMGTIFNNDNYKPDDPLMCRFYFNGAFNDTPRARIIGGLLLNTSSDLEIQIYSKSRSDSRLNREIKIDSKKVDLQVYNASENTDKKYRKFFKKELDQYSMLSTLQSFSLGFVDLKESYSKFIPKSSEPNVIKDLGINTTNILSLDVMIDQIEIEELMRGNLNFNLNLIEPNTSYDKTLFSKILNSCWVVFQQIESNSDLKFLENFKVNFNTNPSVQKLENGIFSVIQENVYSYRIGETSNLWFEKSLRNVQPIFSQKNPIFDKLFAFIPLNYSGIDSVDASDCFLDNFFLKNVKKNFFPKERLRLALHLSTLNLKELLLDQRIIEDTNQSSDVNLIQYFNNISDEKKLSQILLQDDAHYEMTWGVEYNSIPQNVGKGNPVVIPDLIDTHGKMLVSYHYREISKIIKNSLESDTPLIRIKDKKYIPKHEFLVSKILEITSILNDWNKLFTGSANVEVRDKIDFNLLLSKIPTNIDILQILVKNKILKLEEIRQYFSVYGLVTNDTYTDDIQLRNLFTKIKRNGGLDEWLKEEFKKDTARLQSELEDSNNNFQDITSKSLDKKEIKSAKENVKEDKARIEKIKKMNQIFESVLNDKNIKLSPNESLIDNIKKYYVKENVRLRTYDLESFILENLLFPWLYVYGSYTDNESDLLKNIEDNVYLQIGRRSNENNSKLRLFWENGFSGEKNIVTRMPFGIVVQKLLGEFLNNDDFFENHQLHIYWEQNDTPSNSSTPKKPVFKVESNTPFIKEQGLFNIMCLTILCNELFKLILNKWVGLFTQANLKQAFNIYQNTQQILKYLLLGVSGDLDSSSDWKNYIDSNETLLYQQTVDPNSDGAVSLNTLIKSIFSSDKIIGILSNYRFFNNNPSLETFPANYSLYLRVKHLDKFAASLKKTQ